MGGMSAKTQTTGQPGLLGDVETAIDVALGRAMDVSRDNVIEARLSPTEAADVVAWIGTAHEAFRERALADVQAWLRRITA
jgi:hypothetical protein